MAQVSSGLRRVLSIPLVYEAFERTIGSRNVRRTFIDRYVRPSPGETVLDIGCGPGDLVRDLPDVRYVGFDPSEAYIASARARYGDRGRYLVAGIDEVDPDDLGRFDVVIAKSVLHHLDDAQASAVCDLARRVLTPEGRFVTLDAAFTPAQSRVARAIISRDRGRNVRTEDGYVAIAREAFGEVASFLHHDLLRVPYTHIILACRAPRA